MGAGYLGLRCQVLGLISWNAALVDVDGYALLESLDVRDQGWVCSAGLTSDARVLFLFFKDSLASRACVTPAAFNAQACGSKRGWTIKRATAVLHVASRYFAILA